MNVAPGKQFSLPSLDGAVDVRRGSLLFIGTATVLLRYAGFTILTDPNFLHQGEYAHLGYGLRSKRLTGRPSRLSRSPPWTWCCCRICMKTTSIVVWNAY